MKYDQKTKDKILTAAEVVFHENGLKGARTTKIAEKAGVSRTMLHYYFRTKEDLFFEVLQNTFGFFLNHAEKLVQGGNDLKGLLDTLIDLLYSIFMEKPGFPSFMVNITNENPEFITSIPAFKEEHLPKVLDMLLEDAREKGEIDSDISGENLLLNIYGLTSILFLAAPIIRFKEGRDEKEMQSFTEERRNSIKTFIWNGLKT